MTWLGKSNYQPALRDDIFERRSPQRPVQHKNAVPGYHRPSDHNVRSTVTAEPSGAIPAPSAKDASKLRAMIIFREAPHWLTGEQVAMALGLGAADFERKVEAGELRFESKSGPGGRAAYNRDAVRALLLAGG